MPFTGGSENRLTNYLIAIIIGLTARYVTKLLNKSRNKAMYENFEIQSAEEVTHSWLTSLARISLPFQLSLLIELLISMIGLVVIDQMFPDLDFLYLMVLAVVLTLRAGFKWMKIVYLTNLSPTKLNEVARYFNENKESAVEKALLDPEVEQFLISKPLLKNYVIKRMRNLKPLRRSY